MPIMVLKLSKCITRLVRTPKKTHATCTINQNLAINLWNTSTYVVCMNAGHFSLVYDSSSRLHTPRRLPSPQHPDNLKTSPYHHTPQRLRWGRCGAVRLGDALHAHMLPTPSLPSCLPPSPPPPSPLHHHHHRHPFFSLTIITAIIHTLTITTSASPSSSQRPSPLSSFLPSNPPTFNSSLPPTLHFLSSTLISLFFL